MCIWPSLIAADLLNLQKSMESLSPYAAGWHIDIMDNHFVPNLTWGAQFTNAIAQASAKPLWVHLMIDNPEQFLERLIVPKGTYITIHVETRSDISATLTAISSRGLRAGLAVNPKTPIEATYRYLSLIDQLLIMSVEPGFSGQRFIADTLKKITPVKQEIAKQGIKDIALAIDGGVTEQTISEIAKLGVTQFGIASAIFDASNPAEQLKHLNQLVKNM